MISIIEVSQKHYVGILFICAPGHVNEMWRNRVVLLTLTLSLTLTLFSSYSYFIHRLSPQN